MDTNQINQQIARGEQAQNYRLYADQLEALKEAQEAQKRAEIDRLLELGGAKYDGSVSKENWDFINNNE